MLLAIAYAVHFCARLGLPTVVFLFSVRRTLVRLAWAFLNDDDTFVYLHNTDFVIVVSRDVEVGIFRKRWSKGKREAKLLFDTKLCI